MRLYEKPGAVTAGMDRHVLWTRTAHRLLGLPAPESEVHPDYVAGIVTWDPELLAACLARIELVTGTSWASAVGSQLHFSEFILYGTFVRHFGTEAAAFLRRTVHVVPQLLGPGTLDGIQN